MNRAWALNFACPREKEQRTVIKVKTRGNYHQIVNNGRSVGCEYRETHKLDLEMHTLTN